MPIAQQASSAAGKVDAVFLFIVALSAAFLIFITFLMIYFVIRYSRRRNPKGKDIEGSTWLEIVWTVTPTVLFLVMFYYGWTNYRYMRNVPRDAMTITVFARQWAWSFTYPNGKTTTDLYVAYDKPVKLELRSLDVIHGFFVPAFRIKEDVVPGKQNYTWFVPTMLGSFDIQCTVICGINHALMLSKVVVVPVSEFETWYFGDADAPLPSSTVAASLTAPAPEKSAAVLLEKKGCLTCHSIDGSARVGPTFKGLYGRKVAVTADGKERETSADDSYLIRAIQEPGREIVKGYAAAMPSIPLAKPELDEVLAFIKTLN